MPTIKESCHRRLKELGLPMEVELRNKRGDCVARAIINTDGSVSCEGVEYPCPSLFRDKYLGSSLPTYPNIFYKNQSLRELGVR